LLESDTTVASCNVVRDSPDPVPFVPPRRIDNAFEHRVVS